MVMVDFLNSLSLSGAERLLQEEGYTQSECIEKDDSTYGHVFLYPYILYCDNRIIDTVYCLEYCSEIEDDEYDDGRMTWEVQKVEWKRL